MKFTMVGGPREATEDEQRAIDKLHRQEQKRRKRANQFAPLRRLLRLVDQPKRTQSVSEQTGRFLLAIAVRLIPQSERDRYLDEFHAELLDLPSSRRPWHSLSLIRGVFVLRLRGDA